MIPPSPSPTPLLTSFPTPYCQVHLLHQQHLACFFRAGSTEGATETTGAQAATMTIPPALFFFDGESATGGAAADSGATTGAGAAATVGVAAFFFGAGSKTGATTGTGACAMVGVAAFFFRAGSKTGATTGAGACTVAGLAAFFFLDLARWAEDGEEGSPPAAWLHFLVGFGGIMIKIIK
jgi:hypothetical protein